MNKKNIVAQFLDCPSFALRGNHPYFDALNTSYSVVDSTEIKDTLHKEKEVKKHELLRDLQKSGYSDFPNNYINWDTFFEGKTLKDFGYIHTIYKDKEFYILCVDANGNRINKNVYNW